MSERPNAAPCRPADRRWCALAFQRRLQALANKMVEGEAAGSGVQAAPDIFFRPALPEDLESIAALEVGDRMPLQPA